MKNFDLYTELKAYGFKAVTDRMGHDCLTMGWIKREQCFGTLGGVYDMRLNIDVVFNSDRSVATVQYFDGGRSPFKTKVHLNEKRALNAILATAKNHGFVLEKGV